MEMCRAYCLRLLQARYLRLSPRVFQKTVTNDVASSLGNDIKCIPLLVGFMLRQEVSLLGVGCDELLPAEIRRTKFFNLKLPPDPSESSNGLDLYQQTLKIAAAEDTATFFDK